MSFACRLVIDVPNFTDEWLKENVHDSPFESIGVVEKQYMFTALPPIGTEITIHDLVFFTDIKVTGHRFGISGKEPSSITIYASPTDEYSDDDWKNIMKELSEKSWR